MDFVFYSHPTFEPWDWTNPETVGIGGSETSHVEMARRLAERYHVVSYAPIAGEARMGPAGVPWIHSDNFARMENDPSLASSGVIVLYREPEVIDLVPAGRPVWLICQDVHYGDKLTIERANKLTRIVALCEAHAAKLRETYPFAASKVCVSSNGIKAENIPVSGLPERNPKRLIYASSPDRGLTQLLQIFGRVKEIVPDAELHIYYGWDNIDKVIAKGGFWGEQATRNKNHTMNLVQKTGAVWHGRTPQHQLAREWLKSGIWCHPSNFTETSCITCMDAQALGAIPITIPTWAVAENVHHGVFIEGEAAEPLTRARFVLEVVRMMLEPDLQDRIRAEMMPWARRNFDWSRFVFQWEDWARHDLADHEWKNSVNCIESEVHA